ncbi:hypothetical protein FisN_14Lh253 [Fistulifera solaris]|uniref:SEA domain-containing protein n=1 Tax=Fistulifera solaris TaxID=1519565 RepID=A0A1Z5J9Q7_FISSO|nr:hypothetical protein FisN_14Lh253 [Fistulifera solaris]|eukprot:GAX10733.1 hypothetical protein FisN_14Lh253 [Fistulifera solaris]
MKSVLHSVWWFGILAATWVTTNAQQQQHGVFHPDVSSTTSGHRTKRKKSFSSIFVGDEITSSAWSGSGFEPVGKQSSASKNDTPSPTVAGEARKKGESKPPKASPTSRPTLSPTAYTTLSAITEEEEEEDEEEKEVLVVDRPTLQKATVAAAPRTIQLKGDFDPLQSEQIIFQATESLMRTYMNTYGGDILDSFELSLIFYHEYDHLSSVDGHPLMTMYFDVDVDFYVTSYDMDEIAQFSSNKATKLVERFFSGTHLTRLKRRLSAKGLKIKDAQLFTSLPENIPRSETGDKYQPVVSPSTGKQSGLNTVLYAALASGAIMFFVLVAVVLISRRELRKNIKTVLGSLSGSKSSSSYSGSSVSSTVSGGIKPAALHLRRKREEEQTRQMETSSLDGFSYSDKSFGSNFVRSHQPFLHVTRLGARPRESNFVIDDDTDDESVGRLEDGLVASGALTCLDQERSELSKEYPEFELFAHIPRQIRESKPKLPTAPASPVWSVSATSHDVGSTAGDDDYAEQRRRWQDQQLDDLALVLPDHYSDREGPSESDASTGSSRSKKSSDSQSTRNSSLTSKSRSVPAGLRREDEI